MLSNARCLRLEPRHARTRTRSAAVATIVAADLLLLLLLGIEISPSDILSCQVAALVLRVDRRRSRHKLRTLLVGVRAIILIGHFSNCYWVVVHSFLDGRNWIALLLLAHVELERRAPEQVRRVAPRIVSPLTILRPASKLIRW